MKKFKLAVIVFILLIICGCATVKRITPISVRKIEPVKKIDIPPPNKTLRVGEKLTYVVKMLGMEIGECTMEVNELVKVDEKEAYHIIVTATTAPIFSIFYRINDIIHTYFDRETFYFLKSKIIIQQTTKNSNQEVIIDRVNHRLKSQGIARRNYKINIDRPIPPDTDDCISALYRFRTMEINLGQPIEFNVATPKKDWKVAVKIYKSGQVIIPSGCYNAFLVEPIGKARDGGALFAKGRAWIWVSADQNRIPVLIKSRTIFGNPIAYLKEIK